MEFKTVQQKDTLEIIMYFVNEVRVNKHDYNDYLQLPAKVLSTV